MAKLTEKYHLHKKDNNLVIQFKEDKSITLVDFRDFEYFNSIEVIFEVTTAIRKRIEDIVDATAYIDKHKESSSIKLLTKMFVMEKTDELAEAITKLINRLTIDTTLKEDINLFKLTGIDTISKLITFINEMCNILEWTMFQDIQNILDSKESFMKWVDEQVPKDNRNEVNYEFFNEVYNAIENAVVNPYSTVDLNDIEPIGNA